MIFISFLYFVLVFLKERQCISTAQILTTHKPIYFKESSSIHSGDFIFKDASNAVVCDESFKCVRITQFSISLNHSFNCFYKHLPIIISDNQFGFYPPKGGIILSTQKNLDFCRRIKRYTLNERQEIIVIRDSIVLSEKKNADELIEWQLFKNSEFFCWLLYKLSLYDEEHDKIDIMKTLKDANFYLVSLIIIKIFYQKFCLVYECLKILSEESNRKNDSKKAQELKKFK